MNLLAFLARDADALLRFLALSGMEIEDLRLRAGEPELLAALLDFVLADEALLTAFAADEQINPQVVRAARRALPGAPEEI